MSNGLYNGLDNGLHNGVYNGIENGSKGGMFDNETKQVDVDALKFLNLPDMANLKVNEKNAIDTLVKQLKSNSLWTKMSAIYPFVGNTANSCKFNLINPVDSNSAFRLTFSGGWTFSSTGAKPNGTTGYANTYWSSITNASQYSASLGCYLRQNTADGAKCDMGAVKFTPDGYSIIFAKLGGNFYGNANSNGTAEIRPNTNSSGMFIVSKNTVTNTLLLQINNSQSTVITGTSATNTSYVFLGARSDNNSPVFYSDREHSITFFGQCLSNAESMALYNIFTTFKNSLGR